MPPTQPETIYIASFLKVLGHPLRVRIVEILDEAGELPVNAICGILQSEQSLTSHHLNQLRLNQLVTTRREGKQVFYGLRIKEAGVILKMLR